MQDSLWGGADFDIIGVRGLPPPKLITFDPFVNNIVVILVNFLDSVNFFLFFFSIGFFLGGALHSSAYVPVGAWCMQMVLCLHD